MPQDPATFAHTCAAWTAPAVAATVAFWAGIFFGPKTEVSQIFRNETLDASAVRPCSSLVAVPLSWTDWFPFP